MQLRDTTTVTTLLLAGARCDFELTDGPRKGDYDFNFGEPMKLQDEHFINSRAIVATAGDACLVRLLLVHGADANASHYIMTK